MYAYLTAKQVCAFLKLIILGGQLKKSPFARVDRKQNFTFMFLPNFEISDIYPSKWSKSILIIINIVLFV